MSALAEPDAFRHPLPRLCRGAPAPCMRCVARGPGGGRRIRRIMEDASTMTNLKPWQLTSSELAREIEAQEAAIAELPLDSEDYKAERAQPGELYGERDQRKRLSARIMGAAGQQFPDDAS